MSDRYSIIIEPEHIPAEQGRAARTIYSIWLHKRDEHDWPIGWVSQVAMNSWNSHVSFREYDGRIVSPGYPEAHKTRDLAIRHLIETRVTKDMDEIQIWRSAAVTLLR